MKRVMGSLFAVVLFIAFAFATTGWSWTAGTHRQLAERAARTCVELPKPPARCKQPVDDRVLYQSLRMGSTAPDTDSLIVKEASPEHAYNPAFSGTMAEKVSTFYKIPRESVGPGRALSAIDEKVANLGKLMAKRDCRWTQRNYDDLWKEFGRLSHFPADLAMPLHVYSVDTNGSYREGDLDPDGNWYEGLWQLELNVQNSNGWKMHGRIEGRMAGRVNYEGLTCGSMDPIQISRNSRNAMEGYSSNTFPGMKGYWGLITDFTRNTEINLDFFGAMAQQRASDAFAGIGSAWGRVFEGASFYKAPSGEDCEEPTDDEEWNRGSGSRYLDSVPRIMT